MEVEVAYHDRFAPGRRHENYEHLHRCAKAVFERDRLTWFKDEVVRSVDGRETIVAAPKGGGKGESERVS